MSIFDNAKKILNDHSATESVSDAALDKAAELA